MASGVAAFVAAVFFATFVEWVVETFFGKWLNGDIMKYIAAALGLALCIVFRIDLVAVLLVPLGLQPPMGDPYTGQVITGIIVGSGSSAVHKFFGQLGASPSA
jgi:hypothetical protein